MKSRKPRHEFKHYINLADYFALIQRLKIITKQDPYAGENGEYKIRSLYFDNLYDKVLNEKINGVNKREKFRIRYYNDDTSFIKLEKKSKVNGLCYKESALITKEECEKIISGDIEWMRKCCNKLILEFYAKMNFQQLKPKTIVDYEREPFIYDAGNVRITIDKNIRTGIYSKDLFDNNLPTMVTDNEGIMILEIKYDEFIPEIIKNIIEIKDRQASAFSKYAACRIYG
ncbi:VTC domain-containing protein [Clostridium cadaveris]|uniref:VTC domain-containing protein n=1 Tax=Clostridium cadaveris TaxID=1529 RepID=A0A1I2KEJ9_9CLOT|nr:polyphosphate polymerase domain-containing protein [Clostridium cadaveris]MDM8312524.1 polyphosphate polymerase domain-containing protein [Clostridium cadaveris]SFF65475.1 VTC domain-containing protein [Clostridium cadaveris]